MQQFTVEATLREERGKNAARRMRVTGRIPAVLYGGQEEPLTVAVNAKQMSGKTVQAESARTTMLNVIGLGNQIGHACAKPRASRSK